MADDDDPPDPSPDDAPKAVISIEEQKRRAAILLRPDSRAIVERVAKASVGRYGEDAVTEACDLADEEALTEADFPAEGAAMDAFLERITGRVAKRVQRRLTRVRKTHTSIEGHEPIAAQAFFLGDGDPDPDSQRTDPARRAALDEVKEMPAFKMLYERVVHRRPAEEIAVMFNVNVKAYYAATARLRTRMVATAASAAAAFLIFIVVRPALLGPREPVATRDRGPTSYDRALALTDDARKECDLGEWAPCLDLLDRAAAADPAIRDRASYKSARAAAEAALAPKPAPDAGPLDDDRKRGPDKARPPEKATPR